ncbi:MAG: hypothetical protein AAGA96_01175 [Verrucomicrobiota bacterium]
MDSRHRDFLSVMGHLYLVNGKADRAVTVYQCLHAELPDDDLVTLALAFAWLQDGEFSKALDLCEEVASNGRLSVEPPGLDLFIRAKALWGRGEQQEARRTMKEFLATGASRDALPDSRMEVGNAEGGVENRQNV